MFGAMFEDTLRGTVWFYESVNLVFLNKPENENSSCPRTFKLMSFFLSPLGSGFHIKESYFI